MFQASIDPIAGSLGLSALVACVPLLTFFIMLLGVKARAHVSAIVALIVAVIVACVGFQMPLNFALVSATQGAAFGAIPIVYIILMAVWFYQVTVVSGRADDLRAFFDVVGAGDVRIQAMMIAFCFGALLEALAGFGAPVAITATAGAMVSGGDSAVAIATAQHVAAIAGYQAPVLAFVVPILLIFILDGTRGLRDCWAPTLVVSLTFALAQWWCSNHFAYELTDVVASLLSLGAIVLFMRFWKPRGVAAARERLGLPAQHKVAESQLTPYRTFMALVPYLIIVVVFSIGKLGIPSLLSSVDIKIAWPIISGGAILNAAGNDPGTTFTLGLLSTPGTSILVAGLITTAVLMTFNEGGRYRITLGAAVREIGATVYRMRFSALTIILVLSLAYVMNFSGQTMSIGQFLAGAGPAFAFISPVLGWVGTAVTGSDTSSNALFATLQHSAAQANPVYAGITPDLFLAANTMGGVIAKMVSPQSLAIAAVSTQVREADIMKATLPWSLGLLCGLCCLVALEAGPLNFIIP